MPGSDLSVPPTTASGAAAVDRPDLARTEHSPQANAAPFPHIVAWNLTRRCNLACAHCYISAGDWHSREGELGTEACLRILDQILDVNPTPVLILSGGEPLLREDLEILAERAAARGATVVVGTNGVRLTESRIRSLQESGVAGVAVSIDSLDPSYHDRFRQAFSGTSRTDSLALPTIPSRSPHAATDGPPLRATLAAVDGCREQGLDFIVQTTVTNGNRDELREIAAWASDRGAVSFNIYFLVATGRGEGMRGLRPEENEEVLREIVELERAYRGRMMVRSKCQPQLMRHVVEHSPDSPLLNYGTRCPCGVHYVRITPEGKVTPCPYTPVVAGDLRTTEFADIWRASEVFLRLRSGDLKGKCSRCEYRKVCGGCRARALADTGDLMGPDESCAHDPGGDVAVVEPRSMTYGQPADPRLRWTEDARARLEKIPSFVRGVVTSRVESFAEARGYAVVDEALMAEVRHSLPVDFSKKLPFFLRDGADA